MGSVEKSHGLSVQQVMSRMEQTMRAGVQKSSDLQWQAQECVYAAWEAVTAGETIDLLEQALELDSRNVDAWLTLTQFFEFSKDERLDFLRDLVDMGAKDLEKEIKQDKGYFWGLLETRPYMRARAELAVACEEAGRPEEAVSEYEGMLELNPNDNQGVRYSLLGLCLRLGKLDRARELFERYDERQYTAIWAWGYVLERLLSGMEDDAKAALADARRQNRHAEAYLKGHRKIPKMLPDAYSPRSKEEAILCADVLFPVWMQYPKALDWLKKQKSA